MDLEQLCPSLFQVLNLRSRLGVRSFANTVARLLNPMLCDGQLNGFFHTPYAQHMAEANILLNQQRSLVFMGAEGEPELYADRQKRIVMQSNSRLQSIAYPETGATTYPREAEKDLQNIQQHFKQQLENPSIRNKREIATIERMNEAMFYAATGELHTSWRTSSFND
ncbi:MAG: hypothetical protein R8K22_06560 [Mariprofundaceae bacterium]